MQNNEITQKPYFEHALNINYLIATSKQVVRSGRCRIWFIYYFLR